MHRLIDVLQDYPIIAAVNDLEKLEMAIASPCKVVFLLSGHIFMLEETIARIKKSEKYAVVHMDLMEGITKDAYGLRFLSRHAKADGIITTRSNLIKEAKEHNIFSIQRLFILDSMSLESGIKSIHSSKPDAVEILPGILHSVTKKISTETNVPLITGGLIKHKRDVIDCLNAGAISISTSNNDIWNML